MGGRKDSGSRGFRAGAGPPAVALRRAAAWRSPSSLPPRSVPQTSAANAASSTAVPINTIQARGTVKGCVADLSESKKTENRFRHHRLGRPARG